MKRRNALSPEEAEVAEKRAKRAVVALKAQGEEAARAILAHLSAPQLNYAKANYSGLRELS